MRRKTTAPMAFNALFVDIMCNNYTESSVFFLVPPFAPNFMPTNLTSPLDNRTIHHTTSIISIPKLFLESQIEFAGPVLFTAEHIMNGLDMITRPMSESDFQRHVRRVLYSKKDGRKTTIRLNTTRQMTVLDSVFLLVISIEIAVSILCGTIMLFIARLHLHLEEIPTTLNGLSQCWAKLDPAANIKGEKFVLLALNHKRTSGKRQNKTAHEMNHDNSIFTYVGAGPNGSSAEQEEYR